MSYEDRWNGAIKGTEVGSSRTETVFNFIKAFKEKFDGNGPVLEEIVRMLSKVYEIEIPDKRLGNYYIDKLIQKGLIETEATKIGEGLQRSPGRIIVKQRCWRCWEANQDLGSNENYEAITGTVPEQDSEQFNSDLVGSESLL
jgi:hypothetical protein